MKENSLKILKKLTDNGYQAYIVGGFVRDYILKRESYDVDICTDATPKEIKEVFDEAIIPKFEYGSIYLKSQNIDYEITTFRKEIKYENNRKPIEVKYIKDLKEDLLRRDFTINTICMDKDGNIVDLLNGINDLKSGIIKTIKDPDLVLKEDSLRILRAIRFATVLNFKLDEKLKQAIINNKSLLKTLSYERKKEELTRILASEYKGYGISLIEELNLKEDLEIDNLDKALLTKDLLGMGLIIDINNKYMVTKNEKVLKEHIFDMLNKGINIDTMYKYGSYVTSVVAELMGLNRQDYLNKYEKLPIKSVRDINITSDEICKSLSISDKSLLKHIYPDIENKILYGKLNNNKDEIINYIKEKYQGVVYEK